MRTVRFLRERGIFVTGITHPVIPPGLMMYRMIPTADHTSEDIETSATVFAEMLQELELDPAIQEDDAQKIRRVYGR
jgi:glycine C-acetyltransferase